MSVLFKASITGRAQAPLPSPAIHSARRLTEATPPRVARLPVPIHEPVDARSSRDWIWFDEITLSPVVDGASLHLHAASKALHDKDGKAAKRELSAVAGELKAQASAVAKRTGAAQCVDQELARVASWRLAAVALKLDAVAGAVERSSFGGRIGLNALIDGFTCADIERRWLGADESIWYPVCGEAQRHLGDAIDAYARQDRHKAVTDVHKAIGYVRLEAGRAAGHARRVLDGVIAELGRVALSVALGSSRGREAIGNWLPRADLALALAHRIKAEQWWARGVARTTGYELSAAALYLESAARWVRRDAAASARKAAGFAGALGERLVAGEAANREEVHEGIAFFSAAAQALGSKIDIR